MDTSSKRKNNRATGELFYLVALAAGAFLFAVFAVGRVPSSDTHEEILTSLRAIDINHASLQRDVLQARAGLLRNYDPLVSSIVHLHSAVSRLRTLFPESSIKTTSQLDAELTKLAVSIEGDEQLVEAFKTQNSLLQNSLSIAIQMLAKIDSSGDPAVVRGLATAGDLGNLMMRFAAQPDDPLARAIQRQLDLMMKVGASNSSEVQSFIAHTQMILKMLPSVDTTIASIQASPTSFEAQGLQKQYLDAYAVMSVRSAWSKAILGAISGLLCVYVVFLIYRLRTQTYRLTQQLGFEALVSAIRKRFNEDFDSVSAALPDSLRLLEVFFDASRCAFGTIDSKTRHVEQVFGIADRRIFEPLVARFSEQVWDSKTEAPLRWDRFHYQNLHQGEHQALPEGELSAGSLAAANIDAGSVGLLFLEHREIRKAPDRDEIRLLGNAVVVLAQCMKAASEREQRQTLEARLEHAQRLEAVGTLAGGIAHEFNNTLGAILGYAEMALETGRNSARNKQYVQEIVSSGQHAKHIVDQILTFSRKRDRTTEPFDIHEAVVDILPLVKMSIPDTITISLQASANETTVLGNPIEIQQVIMNLCMNAAQASSSQGQIEVAIETMNYQNKLCLSHGELSAGEYVVVSVADRGSGIPQSILPHIFEPFFTTKAKSGGTGLGLAAVHGHVTGMRGRIDVESQPNKGTRFRLFFPKVNKKPVPLAQLKERTVPLGNGEVVLIAQSDTNLRLMYEEKVAALGYEPIGFSNLPALKRWLTTADRKPDLVLLDLDLWPRLPNLTDVLDELRPLATLFLADRDQVSVGRASGQISMLRKPISSVNLATALFNTIGRQVPERQPTQ